MEIDPIGMSLMIRPPAEEPEPDYVDGEFYEINEPGTEKEADIVTPVYDIGDLDFHQGGVYKFEQYQEMSKTRVMVAYVLYLLKAQGYSGDEVYANAWLNIPGAHWLSNVEFKKLLRRAFSTEASRGRFAHTIWVVFDADEVWPYLDQTDKECAKDLRRIGKCLKRCIHLLVEKHEGKGVPRYLNVGIEIGCRPFPADALDMVYLRVCNGHYGENYIVPIEHISRVNDKYDRFGDDEE